MCRVWWDARLIPISPALNGIGVQSPHGIGWDSFSFGCFSFSAVVTVMWMLLLSIEGILCRLPRSSCLE